MQLRLSLNIYRCIIISLIYRFIFQTFIYSFKGENEVDGKRMIESGVNANITNEDGLNSMHWASKGKKYSFENRSSNSLKIEICSSLIYQNNL